MQSRTLLSIAISQAIAILAFVGLPIVVTCVVPRTTIQLRRIAGHKAARVGQHSLRLVPFSTVRIDRLLDANSILKPSRQEPENRRFRRTARTQAAGGSVQLVGADQSSRVQFTNGAAPVRAQQIRDFVAALSAPPISITANGPWMPTCLLGGIMSGFTVLDCAGAMLATIRFLVVPLIPSSLKG